MHESTTPHFGFVLEYVPDISTAKAFYTDILGLKAERVRIETLLAGGSFGRHTRCPGHTEVAAHDQHMAMPAFV